MKALIIENSRLYRQLVDNILGQQSFENDICSTLHSAFEYLKHNQYDLILTNHFLEDGSGLDIANFCKNNQNQNTPILLLTSDQDLHYTEISSQISGVIHKKNLHQLTDQITHFIETTLDPTFYEGKILLVEESPQIANLLINYFAKTEYKIVHFSSADEAWRAFSSEISYGSDKEAIDLVITDDNLSGQLTSHSLVNNIRGIDDARGLIPLMVITPHHDDKHRLALFQSGINDYLKKPILLEELEVRVNNLITNKRLLDKVHDQRRELYTLATTDKLTGCHNRHSLMEFSGKYISQAKRHQYPISLFVIDLDHFKMVNDTHGHAAGDIVLEAIGGLLNKSFREGDLVARFGGEEFVILLNHCDQEYAALKAESLRKDIEALKPHDLIITSSIGISTLTDDPDEDFETLFARSDQAVYVAKESGRNRVVAK